MFFRFVALIVVVTAVSLVKISLEKRVLLSKQVISDQHFHLDQLNERRARLFLATQQLGGPQSLYREKRQGTKAHARSNSQSNPPVTPLLQWRMQSDPESD